MPLAGKVPEKLATSALSAPWVRFLAPLLAELEVHLEVRLARTFRQAIEAILAFLDRNHTLCSSGSRRPGCVQINEPTESVTDA